MDVGHILGRPWLYDLDVTLHGRSNSCSFVFEGKKIKLTPLQPKPIEVNKKREVMAPKGLNIISHKAFERVANQESVVLVLVAREVPLEIPLALHEEPPEEVKSVLNEFQDVFLKDPQSFNTHAQHPTRHRFCPRGYPTQLASLQVEPHFTC